MSSKNKGSNNLIAQNATPYVYTPSVLMANLPHRVRIFCGLIIHIMQVNLSLISLQNVFKNLVFRKIVVKATGFSSAMRVGFNKSKYIYYVIIISSSTISHRVPSC